MKVYYLKFASEQEALSIMSTIPESYFIDSEGKINVKRNSQLGTIDIVGQISVGGEYNIDSQGNMIEIVAPTILDGWHINIMINDDNYQFPEIVNKYIINPTNPYRVFG